MSAETCKGWCSKPATVVFSYGMSCGPQIVPLCDECARRWQKDFHATGAGLSVSIRPIG